MNKDTRTKIDNMKALIEPVMEKKWNSGFRWGAAWGVMIVGMVLVINNLFFK